MFSMVYQIRWLNYMMHYKRINGKNPYADKSVPNEVVSENSISDDVMIMHRKYLFRPNFEDYMSRRKIKL